MKHKTGWDSEILKTFQEYSIFNLIKKYVLNCENYTKTFWWKS